MWVPGHSPLQKRIFWKTTKLSVCVVFMCSCRCTYSFLMVCLSKPFVLLVILVFLDGFPMKTICFTCHSCLFWLFSYQNHLFYLSFLWFLVSWHIPVWTVLRHSLSNLLGNPSKIPLGSPLGNLLGSLLGNLLGSLLENLLRRLSENPFGNLLKHCLGSPSENPWGNLLGNPSNNPSESLLENPLGSLWGNPLKNPFRTSIRESLRKSRRD